MAKTDAAHLRPTQWLASEHSVAGVRTQRLGQPSEAMINALLINASVGATLKHDQTQTDKYLPASVGCEWNSGREWRQRPDTTPEKVWF